MPHFDFPFRFGSDGHGVVVEQDSLEDVSNCVQVVLITRVGERLESPDFGTPDVTFNSQPINLAELSEHILVHEPRASLIFEQHPDKFENLVADITISVSTRQEVIVT